MICICLNYVTKIKEITWKMDDIETDKPYEFIVTQ